MNYETKNYREGIEAGFIRWHTFKLADSLFRCGARVNVFPTNAPYTLHACPFIAA